MFNDIEGAEIKWDRIVSDRHIVRVWAVSGAGGTDYFVTIEQYGSVWEDCVLEAGTSVYSTSDDDSAWEMFVSFANWVREMASLGCVMSFSEGAVMVYRRDVETLDGKLEVARKALG